MLRNIIEETANPPGAATSFLLNGATTGRLPWIHPQSFDTLDVVYYGIEGSVAGTTKVEWGIGKVTVGPPTTFERTAVIGNSDGTTARLNFTGSVRVYNEVPAEQAVFMQSAGWLHASPQQVGAALWATTNGGPNDWNLFTKLPDTLQPGTIINWQITATPTGPVTVNLNGTGASPLFSNERARQITRGDVYNGQVVQMVFAGAAWRMMNVAQRNLIPVGSYIHSSHWSLNAVATCFVPADGRNISRTQYAELHAIYAAMSYPYGAGNGSTTFGVPDLRGRTLFARDNLGGSAAGRLGAVAWTSPTGVNSANQIGAVGGDQYTQFHGHSVIDPGHGHSVVVYDAGQHQHLLKTFVNLQGSGGQVSGVGAYADSDKFSEPGGLHAHSADAVSNGTGIAIGGYGGGNSQNVPPAMIADIYIFAGDV